MKRAQLLSLKSAACDNEQSLLTGRGMSYIARTHRFGLLTPSSNSTQEPEFSEVLPRTISLHTARLSFATIDADTMFRCVEELEHESRKLADADVGVIVLAATAPSVTLGLG